MVAPLEQAAIEAFANQSASIDPVVLTIGDLVQPFMGKISLMVGGLFGLYLIFIIARLYFEHKKVKLLYEIRYNLDKLNIYHGIKSSRERKHFVGRIGTFIKRFIFKKVPENKGNGKSVLKVSTKKSKKKRENPKH
jgi:hypothetical protein